jgi:hypothetical protein
MELFKFLNTIIEAENAQSAAEVQQQLKYFAESTSDMISNLVYMFGFCCIFMIFLTGWCCYNHIQVNKLNEKIKKLTTEKPQQDITANTD